MLVNFFQGLKDGGVPVTPRELLDLLAAMNKQLVFGSIDDFYNLSRAVMVKDEKYYDRFDRAFGLHFRDLEGVDDVIEALIPDDWLRSEFVKQLSDEDKAKIESLGGLEKLIDEFKKRLEEQEKRHEGGNKWVGTGGTSPFGNDGFHPEGIRVGGQGKNKKAVKVWDRRDFKNLDESVEIGTRNIKVALRRLRKFARTGSADELDLDDTISSTAKNAGLDIDAIEREDAAREGRPEAQSILAREVTKLVHGDAGLEAAERITQAMFSGDATSLSESDLAQLSLDGLPSSEISREALPDTLTQLLTDAGMANSGKQVKDALGRAAVTINGRAISFEDNGNPAGCFAADAALHGRFYITRLGKKKVHLFIVD